MILRDQSFKAFCENPLTVIPAVGASSRKIEKLFVFEGLCRGAVQHPVGLPLVQLLSSLSDDNDGGKRRGDRRIDLEGGHDRYRGADNELAELDPLVGLLGGIALWSYQLSWSSNRSHAGPFWPPLA